MINLILILFLIIILFIIFKKYNKLSNKKHNNSVYKKKIINSSSSKKINNLTNSKKIINLNNSNNSNNSNNNKHLIEYDRLPALRGYIDDYKLKPIIHEKGGSEVFKNKYQDNYNLTSNIINYNNYESYRKKNTTKNDLMI